MKDLVLDSRYVHTGNSGITFKVQRDIENPQKANIIISNQAMGGFSTKMKVRGVDSGFTAQQLRDFALMFLESANSMDEIKQGKKPHYSRNTPHLDNKGYVGDLPYNLERFLKNKLEGADREENKGAISLHSIRDATVEGTKVLVKNHKEEVVATLERSDLINDRLKDLISKL